jgi:lipid-binding SYLF domain-containing protein
MRFLAGRGCAVAVTVVALASVGASAAGDDVAGRVDRARVVYRELVEATDRKIPKQLMSDCRCVAVFPHVIQGAFGFGARYGKGVVSCRDSSGHWSPLAPFTLAGGSWGLQIGAEASDVVLFFMTEHGARSLLQSKFTLGAKASVAAGPVGGSAEAETDVKLDAEIYSYARSKGLFAGISLEGAHLAADAGGIEAYYGEPVSAKAILFEHRVPKRPEVGERFIASLP